MSVELKTVADMKYISVKMKKKPKNNSEIIYTAKEAGEICVRTLLFLMCCDNSEKIDLEFMRNNVRTEQTEEREILEAMDFWKERGILDYEMTSAPNTKGANMDNIINIILNISRNMNVLKKGGEDGDGEIDTGLGIYENVSPVRRRLDTPAAPAEPEKYETKPEEPTKEEFKEEYKEDPDAPEYSEAPNTAADTEKPDAPEEIDTSQTYTAGFSEGETTRTEEDRESRTRYSLSQTVSIDKLSESLETKEEFRKLIHEAQIKMQTTFNTADLGIMYNLYENCGMETALILKITEICAEEEKNNIRYVEKVAVGMAASGILTAAEYEENVREMYKIRECEDKIRKIFNVGGKKFTAREKNYIKKWAKEFEFSDEVLAEGYRRCMKQIEKLSFDYINTIYTNWNEKGFKTLDDINGEYGAGADSSGGDNRKHAGFNVDQFFEKAIKKSMKF